MAYADDVKLMEAPRRRWMDTDYSPFRPPINAVARFGLTTALYFLRTPSRPTWLKIGLAADVKRRVKAFQLGNPDIELAAYRTIPRPLDRQVEKLVHQALGDKARGREWFEVTLPEALAAAKPLVARAHLAVHRMTCDGLFGYD